MDLMDIQSKMDRFVKDRGWYRLGSEKPQTGKNLAISLAVEASELLECFQWQDEPDEKAIAEELADVVLYAAQIANIMNIALDDAVQRKLVVNDNRKWMTAKMEG